MTKPTAPLYSINGTSMMRRIADAVRDARNRTGDQSIATRAKAGRTQVVRVSYSARGSATVSAVSQWGSADDTIQFLNTMS